MVKLFIFEMVKLFIFEMVKLFTREQARPWLKEDDLWGGASIENGLTDIAKDIVRVVLEGEVSDKLGYSRYDWKDKTTGNSRNGCCPCPARGAIVKRLFVVSLAC
jgi:hypothetical protein